MLADVGLVHYQPDQQRASGSGADVYRAEDNVDLSSYSGFPAVPDASQAMTPSTGVFAKAWFDVYGMSKEGSSASQASQDTILYGSIRVTNVSQNSVQIDPDTYNYNWESGRFVRNLETLFLKEQAGNLTNNGKDFRTIFIGPTRVP
jgi:hypothetical protein